MASYSSAIVIKKLAKRFTVSGDGHSCIGAHGVTARPRGTAARTRKRCRRREISQRCGDGGMQVRKDLVTGLDAAVPPWSDSSGLWLLGMHRQAWLGSNPGRTSAEHRDQPRNRSDGGGGCRECMWRGDAAHCYALVQLGGGGNHVVVSPRTACTVRGSHGMTCSATPGHGHDEVASDVVCGGAGGEVSLCVSARRCGWPGCRSQAPSIESRHRLPLGTCQPRLSMHASW